MSTNPKPFLTPEQYLEIERKAEIKSEYFRGEMFAMSGGSRWHSRLSIRLVAILANAIDAGKCTLFNNDLRLRVSRTGLYTYPDLSVVCGTPEFADTESDTLLNPTLLVEILSPSTEAYDRGRKFEHYRAIDSLRQYLLVAQDRMHIDLYTLTANVWVLTEAVAGGSVYLSSIDVRFDMSDLYGGLDLPSPTR